MVTVGFGRLKSFLGNGMSMGGTANFKALSWRKSFVSGVAQPVGPGTDATMSVVSSSARDSGTTPWVLGPAAPS